MTQLPSVNDQTFVAEVLQVPSALVDFWAEG